MSPSELRGDWNLLGGRSDGAGDRTSDIARWPFEQILGKECRISIR